MVEIHPFRAYVPPKEELYREPQFQKMIKGLLKEKKTYTLGTSSEDGEAE